MRLGILAGATLFACSCASGGGASEPSGGLPELAKPRVEVFGPGDLPEGDSIRYRVITREDFLADSPPSRAGSIAYRMGAFTCANVLPPKDVKLLPKITPGGREFVVESPRVDFHAEMNRSCSWWNEDEATLPDAYVLQHEQIHFAITELAARTATSRVKSVEGRGRSPESAAEDFNAGVARVLKQIAAELEERNLRFDEDTSGRYDPESQERWWRQVNSELAADPTDPTDRR